MELKRIQILPELKIDESERTIQAVISSAMIDRDREVLLPKGVELDNYLKNPVVLWAHDHHSLPIAKAVGIWRGREQLRAKAQFPPKGESSFSDNVYNLYKGGFLKAFSVGFIPKKWHEPSEKEVEKTPAWANADRIYDEWELLEFSAVPVPANPDALAQAVKAKSIVLSDEVQHDLGIIEREIEEYLRPENVVTNESVKTKAVNLQPFNPLNLTPHKLPILEVRIEKEPTDYGEMARNEIAARLGR